MERTQMKPTDIWPFGIGLQVPENPFSSICFQPDVSIWKVTQESLQLLEATGGSSWLTSMSLGLMRGAESRPGRWANHDRSWQIMTDQSVLSQVWSFCFIPVVQMANSWSSDLRRQTSSNRRFFFWSLWSPRWWWRQSKFSAEWIVRAQDQQNVHWTLVEFCACWICWNQYVWYIPRCCPGLLLHLLNKLNDTSIFPKMVAYFGIWDHFWLGMVLHGFWWFLMVFDGFWWFSPTKSSPRTAAPSQEDLCRLLDRALTGGTVAELRWIAAEEDLGPVFFLVGGLVAINFIFAYIGNVIIPIDELIFFRGVQTTNQF